EPGSNSPKKNPKLAKIDQEQKNATKTIKPTNNWHQSFDTLLSSQKTTAPCRSAFFLLRSWGF
ncbi:MAG TPA: hypothetical protein VG502_02495, partial [Flexivirga sp.]|uniref:hypothetical protein n=1 Tax=Flexivirga sp. TaxID=1962927 RepID=UPI002CCD55B3